jgi:hypothetical protein
MPLAHPLDIQRINNYSAPAIAITFATSKPGEDVDDFQARLRARSVWGEPGRGRHGVELAFTRDTAEELVRMLTSVVGRARIGEIIDSP